MLIKSIRRYFSKNLYCWGYNKLNYGFDIQDLN